jgi:hypothetical protein
MGVTLFWLHDREQDRCLVPFGNVCPAISPIQQQAMAARQVSSRPDDRFKRGLFAAGAELPIQGGISAFGQVRLPLGDEETRTKARIGRQIVAA